MSRFLGAEGKEDAEENDDEDEENVCETEGNWELGQLEDEEEPAPFCNPPVDAEETFKGPCFFILFWFSCSAARRIFSSSVNELDVFVGVAFGVAAEQMIKANKTKGCFLIDQRHLGIP